MKCQWGSRRDTNLADLAKDSGMLLREVLLILAARPSLVVAVQCSSRYITRPYIQYSYSVARCTTNWAAHLTGDTRKIFVPNKTVDESNFNSARLLVGCELTTAHQIMFLATTGPGRAVN